MHALQELFRPEKDSLLDGEVHKPDNAVRNLDDWATSFAKVSVLLSAFAEIVFSSIDDEDL